MSEKKVTEASETLDTTSPHIVDGDVGTQDEMQSRPLEMASTSSEKLRTFVHDTDQCGHETTLEQVEYDDIYSNPDRYAGLACARCGVAIRAGEYGELIWKGTQTKVLGEGDSKEKHG